MRIRTFKPQTGSSPSKGAPAPKILGRKNRRIKQNGSEPNDHPTGLPNKYKFFEVLKSSLPKVLERRQTAAVVFLSIDRFKLINDALGHQAGDSLLINAARKIRETLRSNDIVARPGRNEFMVFLPKLNKPYDAMVVAEKLVSSFNYPFKFEAFEFFISVSAGVCVYPGDGKTPEELLRNSYTALQMAKRESANSYRFYSPNMNVEAFGRLELENQLRFALKRDEFELNYQPVVELSSGRVSGFEALLRWRHPELGNISPARFIPLAEESGLIIPIGQWVVEEAANQLKTWIDEGLKPPRVAVNLSARQFHQKNLLERITGGIVSSGIGPENLEFELTETSFINTAEKSTISTLNSLRDMGIKITLDDFGTGYSSLYYLKLLPFDKLKIEENIAIGGNENASDHAIAQAIIGLAHGLGLEVVAERIETEQQLQYFKDLRCDHGQGFLMSPPLGADEAAMMIKNPSPWHALFR